jgi:hypothetical protein
LSRVLRLAVVVLLLAPCVSRADDRWSSPHAGVAVLHRRARGIDVRAVVADVCTPGLRVRATRPEERGRTTSSYAELTGATVAINGDFYDDGFAPVGLALGDGARWADTFDTVHWGVAVFGEGRAEIALPEDPNEPPEPWVHEAIGGVPQLVIDGLPISSYPSRFCRRRHPRSAVGVSADGRSLIFVVADGRSERSAGMTCAELAELMAELGAEQAINLDGGGSSALYVRGRGVINRPSEGAERVVANHLALVHGGAEGVDLCPWRNAAPPGGLEVCDGVVPIDGRALDLDDASECFSPSGPSLFPHEDHHATTSVSCATPGPRACAESDTSARWYFHVEERARYRVEVRVPASAGAPLTERARYTLRERAGLHAAVVDQRAARGGWVVVFPDVTLDRQNNVALELGDNTGEPERRFVAFDAVRISRVSEPPTTMASSSFGLLLGFALLVLGSRRAG